jgi:hypothetical protein
MEKTLACVNCGANLSIKNDKKYILCEYCGTPNANFTTYESIDLKKINDGSKDKKGLEKLALCFKLKDYFALKNNSEEFLKKYPGSWIAMTYLAIGEFWTGFDDFKHINRVKNLLTNAIDLSNRSEFVLDAKNRIENNSLVIATKSDIYGDGLINSLKIFDNFLNEDNIKNENKTLVREYSKKVFEKYKIDLDKLYSRSGNSTSSTYDPPYIAVINLFDIAIITDNDEILLYFYTQVTHHIRQNGTKSYINELIKKKTTVEDLLKSKNVDLPKVKSKNYSPGCFIATATLGSNCHPMVLDLQQFRDTVLMQNSLGRLFIKCYYKFSPYFAKIISNNPYLKMLSLMLIIKPLHTITTKRS